MVLTYFVRAKCLLQSFSDLHLVAIDGSTVDVTVASLQGPDYCLFNLEYSQPNKTTTAYKNPNSKLILILHCR